VLAVRSGASNYGSRNSPVPLFAVGRERIALAAGLELQVLAFPPIKRPDGSTGATDNPHGSAGRAGDRDHARRGSGHRHGNLADQVVVSVSLIEISVCDINEPRLSPGIVTSSAASPTPPARKPFRPGILAVLRYTVTGHVPFPDTI
jgi:hypothetical protein